jgi:acylphosphatase
MKRKSVFMILTGRVQGVGFRYFALHKAIELDISGWVKNTYDNKLEIEATGDSDKLEIFIDWMKTGPIRSIVKTISVTEIIPIRDFTNFTIH